jgi:hypothetical protein
MESKIIVLAALGLLAGLLGMATGQLQHTPPSSNSRSTDFIKTASERVTTWLMAQQAVACTGTPDWKNPALAKGNKGAKALSLPLPGRGSERTLLVYFNEKDTIEGAVVVEITFDSTYCTQLSFHSNGEPLDELSFNGSIALYSVQCTLLGRVDIQESRVVRTFQPDTPLVRAVERRVLYRLLHLDERRLAAINPDVLTCVHCAMFHLGCLRCSELYTALFF